MSYKYIKFFIEILLVFITFFNSDLSIIGGFGFSLFWIRFRIYQNNRNVIIPNILGLLFAIIQVTICLIYYYKQNKNNTIISKIISRVNFLSFFIKNK